MADDLNTAPPAPTGSIDPDAGKAPPPPAGSIDPAASAVQAASIVPPTVPMGDMTSEETAAYEAAQAKVFHKTPPGMLSQIVTQAFKLDQPLGLDSETEKSLQQYGITNGPQDSGWNPLKDFNSTVIRGGAVIGDAALRVLNAAVVLPAGAVNAATGDRNAAEDAQRFNDDLMVVLGTSPEAAIAAHGDIPEAPKPPSLMRPVVQDSRPWQADIPPAGEEAAAAKAPPPITGKPAPGSPLAKQDATMPSEPGGTVPHPEPLLDGSGNLNLDYINASKDNKETMAKVSDAYAQRYGTTMPQAETVEQANKFFADAAQQVTDGVPSVLTDYERNGPVNSDLLWTARQAFTQSVVSANRMAMKAAQTGDPADLEAATAAAQRVIQYTSPARHEMTATAGRTLNSMKIPVGDTEMQNMEQVGMKIGNMNAEDAVRVLGTLDTPQAVAKFIGDVQKPSFTDMGMYYIFNNYLSGPLTHLAYTASWGIQTVIRAGIETPMAAAIGKLQEAAGKTINPEELTSLAAERTELVDRMAEADRPGSNRPMTAAESQSAEKRLAEIDERTRQGVTVMPHEAAARFYGIGEGALDSIRAFGRALKTSDIQMLPGEMDKAEQASKEAIAAALKEGAAPEDAKAAGHAAYQNVATNFGNPIVAYGKQLENPKTSATVQAVGHVVGAPMRVIAAIHSLQKFSGYSESLNALAYRQAASEGLEGGRAAIMDDTTALGNRVAQLKNNPTPEMMEQAIKESKYAALMGESGVVGRKFQSLANSNSWTRIVVPFSKVVTNLTAQKVLERTPIGMLSKVVRSNIMGENGNAAQATQGAKMLAGSTLLMGGAYLAAQGQSRGWGSDDKNERAFDYLSGNPPYSVRIGDVNLPHRFFGVAGGSLSLGADLHDINQTIQEGDEGYGDWLNAMGSAVHYIGRDLLTENALTGPAELYNAINDKQDAGARYVPNAIASALTPFSSFQNQVNSRFIDPIMRQTMGENSYSSIMQTIESRTPYLSQNLMPKVDIFGNPMQRSGDHSWAEKDPVMQALTHLQIFPAAVQPRLFGVQLDEKQFADYGTLAGRAFYKSMIDATKSPSWVRLPDQDQANVVQIAIKASRGSARAAMVTIYPQIVQDSKQQKLDLLHQYDE